MLRGNLSTRPFYNERLVTLLIMLVGAVALALTAYNAITLMGLTRQRSEMKAVIDQNNGQSARIRNEAERLQKSIDRSALNLVSAATHEASGIIEARTFSWTSLLGQLEKTLPFDVKLIAISPRTDRGILRVELIVLAKQLDDVATFVESLNQTNSFLDVVPAATDLNEDQTYSARIVATYFSPRDAKAAATVPAAAVKPPAAVEGAAPPKQGGSR